MLNLVEQEDLGFKLGLVVEMYRVGSDLEFVAVGVLCSGPEGAFTTLAIKLSSSLGAG